VLRYWHDLSYKEIAEILDLSEPAIKTRLHRARLQLAALLDDKPAAATADATAQKPAHADRRAGPLSVLVHGEGLVG
jgi:hypothetical protein